MTRADAPAPPGYAPAVRTDQRPRPTTSRTAFALACLVAAIGAAPHALAQTVAPFERAHVSTDYWAEGADVGDFDGDGVMDVTSGPWWWRGPDFAVQHALYAGTSHPLLSYSPHFTSHVFDVDGDGDDDVVAIRFPGLAASWFENPGAGVGAWNEHLVFASVGSESPAFVDLVAGGALELLCAVGTDVGYLTPDPIDPLAPWTFHTIFATPFPLQFLHGLGAGDVNGDGRSDVLLGAGWLEQPASLAGDPPWTFTTWSFGSLAGSQMFTTDVDGDGDNDLVSSIDAHGYGLSWFESSGGALPTFTEHTILPRTFAPPATGQFSQLHALALADIDGDGLDDIVSGKTYLAHNGTDPGAFDPALLCWFRLDRSTAPPTFEQHVVDSDSGVGRQVVVRDVNGDARPDIVVGNKKGVLVFERSQIWSNVASLTYAAGGAQVLELDAGLALANGIYLVAGTLSGTSPGTTLPAPGGPLHLPINQDVYTQVLLAGLNGSTFVEFFGFLDANGRGHATLAVPPGLVLPPLTLHHAFVAWDALGQLKFASHAQSLALN